VSKPIGSRRCLDLGVLSLVGIRGAIRNCGPALLRELLLTEYRGQISEAAIEIEPVRVGATESIAD
jgi:hypothetical protein